ncbi:Lrp/AsnC family transcriptional regulator [Candidatus Bathyarchaeota archaeon]|nr:Lrp/AsnC family transcriptional regulator [Candidatus Bathyarchaeota archaeon]
MSLKFDEKDLAILDLLQKNCKMTAKEIARKINSPITTVFAKIKRMEQQGIIKEYRAILDHKKLNFGVTAFILASFSYRVDKEVPLSQRAIAEQISKFPEVQEVHIISGDWDILIKVKDKDVDSVGRFVIDKLRTVKGIEKTLTCMVFDTPKETTTIPIPSKIFRKL